MTVLGGDFPGEADRRRTRDQLELFTGPDPDLIVATETGDPADVSFICDRHHVLLPPVDPELGPDDPSDAAQQVEGYFTGRLGGQSESEERDDDLVDDGAWGAVETPSRPELPRRYRLPGRRVPGDQDLLLTLDELDRDLGRGVAVPDHLVHVAFGWPKICPATEPAETGLPKPWPPVNRDETAGQGVSVVVVDSGWHAPAGAQPWLRNVTGMDEPQGVKDARGRIRPYAGHGTFVAGVIRAMAPACKVYVLSLHVNPDVHGGGVREHELVERLDRALRHRPKPHLINLSAGTRTRYNQPPRAFRDWWRDVRTTHPDLVLVAAAGNDSSPEDFWPASFDWAVGVGALDRDGRRSSFSNYGPSVDVYALGRNLVNAFPSGTYIGHEPPIQGDERRFTKMLARWSGTSFSAPVITGLIAAEMSKTRPLTPAPQARDAVLRRGVLRPAPGAHRVPVLMPPYS